MEIWSPSSSKRHPSSDRGVHPCIRFTSVKMTASPCRMSLQSEALTLNKCNSNASC